ncbi:T9SS type A sorting domain-containing protein [candidate division WOR-3 bacterium]|nr:T9SS type A sorting domain-containing protein [candidate division WOR-3 bacterium]
MKKVMVVLFLIFGYLTAQDFLNDYRDRYEIASPRQIGTRNEGVVFDSLKQLPPRMRGFGDEEYFEMFIKPQTRDSLNVRCVGRWPFGPGFEVYGDTVNNILCFGSGSGVLVFDINAPSNPVKLSQICVNGLIMQVYLRDTLLFVSSYGNGVEVFNLANPSSPVKISQIDVPARDFCLQDTFAYCVAEDSLRIINIADILNPFQVGACMDSGYVVSVSGDFAFTGGRWKLSAIDVSNPANPQVVNSIPAYVYTLTVDGNHCYCVLNTDGFTIYNISDPMNIWQESQLNTVGGVDIYKLGFYVYLPGFVIVDVGDSANPFVVGDTSLPVYAQAVWVNNNFGYGFVANDYEGLTVININDPTNPQVDSQYYGADNSRDVFVQGNYAYVANLKKGLKIIDIGNPSNPFEVGEYDTIGTFPYLQTIWTRDTLVYIPVEWPFVFKVLNVSDPGLPSLLGYCNMKTVGSDIFVKDTFAYVVGSNIFQTFNVSIPTSPDSLHSYVLPHTTSRCVFIKDTFAYIANADSGLRILNVSNPTAPFEVGYFTASEPVYSVFVKDTLAYLAALGAGLRIVNVVDPTSPQEIGYYITTGSARDVIVNDSIAYIAAAGLRVININDTQNPTEVGYYITSYAPRRLFFNGTYIFAACFESGMDILKWDDTGIEENDKNRIAWTDFGFALTPTITKRYLNLSIHLSTSQNCDIVVYDEVGKVVADIVKNKKIKGEIKEKVDLSNLPAGVYFIILKVEDKQLVRKFVLVQ